MRICFFGDSFVNGTGDDACLGWTGRVCADARRRGMDVTSYNLGVRRDTARDIAARWKGEAMARLQSEHDGRLVFSFGVNDCVDEMPGKSRFDETETLFHAHQVLSQARAWLPTLMIGPPPIGDATVDAHVKALSNRLSMLCRDLSIPFLPTCEPLATDAVWLDEIAAGDGAHPNSGGYAVLANLVSAWPPWRAWLG